MLFAGPTGVGKTQSAKALADYFFGKGQTKNPLVRIDMSEFQHPSQIVQLIGGGKNVGKLVQEIREKPFAVLLLDEVEKVCTHVVVLRKGEKLYSGRVDQMISSNGLFELKCDNEIKLLNYLKTHACIKNTKIENGLITAFLETPIAASTFNEELLKNGISLSHLVQRKERLHNSSL